MTFAHFTSFAILSGLLFLTGCAKPPSELNRSPLPEPAITTAVAFTYANHALRDRTQRKSYFLIAGAADAANFAQEIIEQRAYFLSLGVPAEKIACFYARPTDADFALDKKHFTEVAPALKSCFPAYPQYIWEQLQDGGEEADSLYVYATSHGSPPLSHMLKAEALPSSVRKAWNETLEDHPELEQYRVALDVQANGKPAHYAMIVDFLKRGLVTPTQVLFTPRYLKAALNQAAPRARKQVVVQACYSGGFVSPEAEHRGDALTDLPRITALSAARHDRPSFGCGVGNHRTYYGGIYNDALFATKQLPKNVKWNDLQREIDANVTKREAQFFQDLSPKDRLKFKHSSPQFFTND